MISITTVIFAENGKYIIKGTHVAFNPCCTLRNNCALNESILIHFKQILLFIHINTFTTNQSCRYFYSATVTVHLQL